MPNQTSPAVPRTQRVGLIVHEDFGERQVIRFRKPWVMIGLLALPILLLLVLTVISVAIRPGNGPTCSFLFAIPFLAVFLISLRLARFDRFIRLEDDRIMYCRGADGGLLGEVEIDRIHSISSEGKEVLTLGFVAMLLSRYLPRHPEILIVAEPKNLVLKGPRGLSGPESDFLLHILDRYYRRLPR